MPARTGLVSGLNRVFRPGVALFAYFFLLMRKSMDLLLYQKKCVFGSFPKNKQKLYSAFQPVCVVLLSTDFYCSLAPVNKLS